MRDLTNNKYGRLQVVSSQGKRNGHFFWLCKCDCGGSKIIAADSLIYGVTKSCGCLNIEKIKERSTKHGESVDGRKTVEYITWRNIKSRCYNPKNADYYNYGARGIRVCDRWLASFNDFLQDMGRRPTDHSIDRINTDGNYEPSNCKWSTRLEQAKNKRNAFIITHNGTTKSLADWAKDFNTIPKVIKRRFLRGVPIDTDLRRFSKQNTKQKSTA